MEQNQSLDKQSQISTEPVSKELDHGSKFTLPQEEKEFIKKEPFEVSKKVSLIVLSILAVVLIVGGAMVVASMMVGNRNTKNVEVTPTPQPLTVPNVSPTPVDETADWEVYRSEDRGFEIKYPDTYFKYLYDTEETRVYLAPSEGSKEALGSPIGLELTDVWLEVSAFKGFNVKTIEEYLGLPENQEFYKNTEKQSTAVDQVPGYRITRLGQSTSLGPQITVNYQVLALKEGTIYQIALSGYRAEVLTDYEVMFDQIVSTFRFLEKNNETAVAPDSSWTFEKQQDFLSSKVNFQTPENWIRLDCGDSVNFKVPTTYNSCDTEWRSFIINVFPDSPYFYESTLANSGTRVSNLVENLTYAGKTAIKYDGENIEDPGAEGAYRMTVIFYSEDTYLYVILNDFEQEPIYQDFLNNISFN